MEDFKKMRLRRNYLSILARRRSRGRALDHNFSTVLGIITTSLVFLAGLWFFSIDSAFGGVLMTFRIISALWFLMIFGALAVKIIVTLRDRKRP
jgi:hypothetical protein